MKAKMVLDVQVTWDVQEIQLSRKLKHKYTGQQVKQMSRKKSEKN